MREAYAKGRTGTLTCGEKHPCAKLTDAQVKYIRAAYLSNKATQQQLAHQFGVRQSTISLICSVKRRPHVQARVKGGESPMGKSRLASCDWHELALAALSFGLREFGVDKRTELAILERFEAVQGSW
jgi:hypothetical protein